MTAMLADPVLAELDRQTAALLSAVRSLTQEQAGGPSALPRWTRGHVLTHLARNADALTGVLSGAAEGRIVSMYPDQPSRNADIEAGAGRPVADLAADLEASWLRLREQFGRFPDAMLDVRFTSPHGWFRPARYAPWLRWREVVLHHVDLDLGARLDPGDALLPRLLAETVQTFAERPDLPPMVLSAADLGQDWQLGVGGVRISGDCAALAGWLTGRSDGTGLTATGSLPARPPWA